MANYSQFGAMNNLGAASGQQSRRKRKSRWATDVEEKIFIPGMPTVISSDFNREQEQQYILQLQIEEISRRLRTGDLGIPPNPENRSPSPEPIYNNEGKRLNTREYRTRKKLEEQRHDLIKQQIEINEEYKPPSDYKPPVTKVTDKVMIPQEDHPDINFVGLLIGPRGNTLKNLEKDTGAKIIIRGKGSVKEGKIGRKDGMPLPGEDEPLHAYITATNPEHVAKASIKIKEIIQQGIEVPEQQNDLRRQQLRELALLNGTLRENDGLAKLKQLQHAQTIITNTIYCAKCGGTGHIQQDCKSARPGDSLRSGGHMQHNPVDRAKMDSEYSALMAELGEGPPTSRPHSRFSGPPPGNSHMGSHFNPHHPPPGGRPTLQLPPPTMAQSPPPSGMPPHSSQFGPPHHQGGPSQSMGGIPALMSANTNPPPLMGGQHTQPPTSQSLPWQQQNTNSSAQHFQSNQNMRSNVGMAPQSAMAPPPPPPPTSQHMPWQQQQQQQQQHHNYGMGPPPHGPPSGPPWQQQQQHPGHMHHGPPSGMPPPWQQHMGGPHPGMMPPPPPPGQNYGPPPPPPGGDMGNLGIPLGVPPPPPPS